MRKYTTAAEDAASIRAALKALGWSSRQISVRSKTYSGGSSILVEVKDPSIQLKPVEKASRHHERVHRDQFGDILSGGNRFITVEYSRKAHRAIQDAWIEPVSRAVSSCAENTLIPVEGTPFLVGHPTTGTYTLWGEHFITHTYGIERLAFEVGARSIGQWWTEPGP